MRTLGQIEDLVNDYSVAVEDYCDAIDHWDEVEQERADKYMQQAYMNLMNAIREFYK